MSNLIENRQIRVFISSTFRDLQDERDYLMKRTFPKLRKLAAERDVTLTELDLRWGITEEEAKSGKVVEICLREIENSIPFFIGIIGNRYGWVPTREDLGENVAERFTDVNKYIEQHLSVTEMEMQFGVLSREEDMHAYFYIKEQDENTEKVDHPEMLNRLKQEVYKSRYPSSGYKSPEDLAMQVEDAFTKLLDTLFSEGNLSELEKERIGQRSFMNQLCQNYIKNEKIFDILDTWLADKDSRQFVVTGASGLGKSALIANWLKEKQQDVNRHYNIIYHFTGNGGSESNSEHISRCIINELKDLYGWREDNHDRDTILKDLFLRVSAEGDKPLLIVIDAINQIVDFENAKLLNWLPLPPKGIKILFSTLENDRTMEVFKNRKSPIYNLQPLNIEHRSLLIKEYLKLYAKSLNEKQVERIATDSQCENTLVLKTLLDELINFGIYEKLDVRIEYYLSTESTNGFYQALLASYEEDYKEYDENFVKKILSLLAVSRNGLTEEEIVTIAGIKRIQWSQFYCSFFSDFTIKNGCIIFSHSYIREAIIHRYFNDKPWINRCRKKIITYFKDTDSRRSVEELLCQYEAIEDYLSMHRLLLDLRLFGLYYKLHPYELGRYWNKLIEYGYSVDEYLSIDKDDISNMQKRNCYVDLCAFSQEIVVDFKLAIKFAKKALEITKNENDDYKKKISEANLYNILGGIHSDLYEMEEAIGYNERALAIQKTVKPVDKHEISISYGNLGLEYLKIKDLNKGLEYCRRALEIKKEIYGDSHPWLASAYNNLGLAYLENHNFDDALDNFKTAIEIQLAFYGEEHKDIAIYYNNMSHLYGELKNDYNEALVYALKALKIRENTTGFNTHEFANAIHDVGYLYGKLGNLNKQLDCALRACRIGKSTWGEKHPYIAIYCNNIGSIYAKLGNYQKALEYKLKALGIREHVLGVNHIDTARSYFDLGNFYLGPGKDFRQSIAYFKNALESGCLKPANKALANKNISICYRELGDFENALEYAQRALELAIQEYGEQHLEVARCLNSVGLACRKLNKLDEALQHFQAALEIRKQLLPADDEDVKKSEAYIKETVIESQQQIN